MAECFYFLVNPYTLLESSQSFSQYYALCLVGGVYIELNTYFDLDFGVFIGFKAQYSELLIDFLSRACLFVDMEGKTV